MVLVTESLASDSAPSASSVQDGQDCGDGAASSLGSMEGSVLAASSPPVEPVRASGPPQEVGVNGYSFNLQPRCNKTCNKHATDHGNKILIKVVKMATEMPIIHQMSTADAYS